MRTNAYRFWKQSKGKSSGTSYEREENVTMESLGEQFCMTEVFCIITSRYVPIKSLHPNSLNVG